MQGVGKELPPFDPSLPDPVTFVLFSRDGPTKRRTKDDRNTFGGGGETCVLDSLTGSGEEKEMAAVEPPHSPRSGKACWINARHSTRDANRIAGAVPKRDRSDSGPA